MFINPASEYKKILKAIKSNEEKGDCKQMFCYSLDAIPFMIGAQDSHLRKYGNTKPFDYRPFYYACDYLSVLREKEELKNLGDVVDHTSLSEKLKEKLESALKDIDIMDNIIHLLKDQSFISKVKLFNKLNVEEKNLNNIFDRAKDLEIILIKEDKIYLNKEIPTLKSIMEQNSQDLREKCKFVYFNKLKNTFFK